MQSIFWNDYWKLPGKERHSYTGVIIDHKGYKQYLENGKTHRLDGPAIMHEDNSSKSYFVHGIQFTKKQWEKHPEVILHKIKNSEEFKDVLKFKNL